jgi:hypothetical protein
MAFKKIIDGSALPKGVESADNVNSTIESTVETSIAALVGSVVSKTNGTATTASTSESVIRNITLSTSQPSGGMDGDVWMVYT